MKINRFLCLPLIVITGLLLIGCGRVAGVMATPTVTLPATSTPEPTATPQPSATHTSLPTSTPEPTSTRTRVPIPTRDRTATMIVMATASAERIVDLLRPDLEAYGVDPADGHVAWLQTNQVRMELTNYLENRDHILKDAGILSDFVIQSRVTWDTSGALSLCGITFRADEDFAKGAQNRFFLMRLQFDPIWTIWQWEYGQFQSFLPGEWVSSRNIHDKNGSSNLLALVVRGKDIDVFINRDKQRRLEDTKRKEGLLALSAYHESGRTICKFENSWVWAIDK